MGFKFRESWYHSRKLKSRKQKFIMGVPVLALFRENKIRESHYYCHSRNSNPSKFMPYTVLWFWICEAHLSSLSLSPCSTTSSNSRPVTAIQCPISPPRILEVQHSCPLPLFLTFLDPSWPRPTRPHPVRNTARHHTWDSRTRFSTELK